MAFKIKKKWECEHCGYIVWAEEQPEDYECPNYKDDNHNPCEYDYEEEIAPKPVAYSKEELKERYRIAFHLRGGTWEGVQPYPWTGDDLQEGRNLCDDAKRESRLQKMNRFAAAMIRGE